jgi:hypothetical protein
LRMSAAFRSPLLFCFDGTSIFTVVAAVAFEIGGGFPWSRGSSAISEIISETMFVMLNRKPFSSPLVALPDYVRELACPSQFATRRHLLICRIYSLLCSLLPPVLVRFGSGNRCMWGCLFPLTAGGFVLPFLDPSCSLLHP